MASNKLLPGGFPEQNLISQKRENVIKELIQKGFEGYGFVNIETPAIESIDVLIAKGGEEVSKQIFGLYGLAQGADNLKKYALHFDLTVPLARYVIDHENDIKFPFKRYQIQKVWRGERQQKGRFKEFYQCDVDVIDNDLNIYYDAEVIEVLYNTIENVFTKLDLDKNLIVKLNNRGIYDYLFNKHTISDLLQPEVLGVIDSYYKYQTTEDFYFDLKKILGAKCEDFLADIGMLSDFFKGKMALEGDAGLSDITKETSYVINLLKDNGIHVVFDPYIVRGLDYYDGTVFETYVDGHEDIGSVCSGGRYSNLVSAIRDKNNRNGKKYGGVGGSIGLSRLLYVMQQEGFLKKEFSLSDIIVFNLDKNINTEKARHEIARVLRSAGIRVDHYINSDKLQKQFNYASSKKIPFGVFVEDNDISNDIKIRNLSTREDISTGIDELAKTVLSLLKD